MDGVTQRSLWRNVDGWFRWPTHSLLAALVAPASAWSTQGWWAVPTLITLAGLTSALLAHRSLDGHEVLVAQTAREMLRSGDGVVPRFAGEVRLQKPPLAYWLSAGSMAVTGASTAASSRLPSAIAALAMTLLVSVLVKANIGRHAALFAGVIQATSWWAFEYGQSATVEMTLVSLVSATLVVGSAGLWAPEWQGGGRVLMFWGLAALVVLAKGPVGLAFVAMTLALGRIWCGPALTGRLFRSRWHGVGLLLFVASVSAWPIAVARENLDAWRIWWEQSVGRYVARWGPPTRPWYYYTYQVPLLTLPWGWLAWAKLRSSTDVGTRAEQLRRWCWVWLGSGLLFLSFSQGKRDHYALPILPAVSVLAGMAVADAVVRDAGRTRRYFWAVSASSLAVAVGLSAREGWSEDAIERLSRESSCLAAERTKGETVWQLGSNDHATAFALDVPMRWGSYDDWYVARSARGSTVVLPPGEVPICRQGEIWSLVGGGKSRADWSLWRVMLP
jgi:4-amino-4-deoxy-L-arabinose transferase-like glycosyltransferase